MALLKPNSVYVANGVTVNEKIIPDGTRWQDAEKAKRAGFKANALYKKQAKLCKTGKAAKVTIHNTDDLKGVDDDAEQYTRATYNENMGSVRVHYYVDDLGAWQNLRAGCGGTKSDPLNTAEVSWHSGDGSVVDGGNMTSLSIEVIMNDNKTHDEKAKDNAARLTAWLLWKHGLDIDDLVTHTYWVNKSVGRKFTDVDEQCCSPVSGQKWCPTYIFASSNKSVAMRNWKAFKQLVKGYLDNLNNFKEDAKPSEIPYLVRINTSVLNIRKQPTTKSAIVGAIRDRGVYTIVEESDGAGATKWGKLKSGAGWISLDYTKRM